VILADSSAWVEYYRKTGSRAHLELRALIESSGPLVTTEVVVMELLAGARTDREADLIRGAFYAYELLNAHGLEDYEHAAAIYRACRRAGQVVRRQLDCLIAAVAIREDAAVLHQDRDFDVIARHTGLRIA
jgi:predicted nucleic acid-binding protein